MRIHQDRAQSLWQALKRQSQNLWLNGTMFALIIDLISMSAGNIICKLAEIRDSVCVDDLNEDDTFDDTEHTHESTEDKVGQVVSPDTNTNSGLSTGRLCNYVAVSPM